MKTDGQTFKIIRESRKIKQNEITFQTLSRTTLSKFENDKVVLSMNNFKYLLQSLDVTLEEFNYIKNGYSNGVKEQILHDFSQLFSTSDVTLIEKIMRQCNDYLKTNYSRAIKCIYNVMHVLKYTHDSSNDKISCHTKIYIADIWDELSQVENWTILDIRIINCCLHFFESEAMIGICDQLIKNLKKYEGFSNILLLETSIYLNLTLIFLLKNEREKAKEYAGISLKKANKSKRIDYIAISFIRSGIAFSDETCINNGLNLLDVLGDQILKNGAIEEISTLKHLHGRTSQKLS